MCEGGGQFAVGLCLREQRVGLGLERLHCVGAGSEAGRWLRERSELHKGFGPLWNPQASDEAKQGAREMLAKKFAFAEQQLGAGPFVMGTQLTIADPYLFVIANWTGMHGIDLARWPGLVGFTKRMRERPAVDIVLRAEGLVEEDVAG